MLYEVGSGEGEVIKRIGAVKLAMIDWDATKAKGQNGEYSGIVSLKISKFPKHDGLVTSTNLGVLSILLI